MAALKRFLSNKGSGFVELMIALTILNIILLSLIPSFVYSIKSTLRSNFRTTAYNLGIRQLERVKSLDYGDVGTVNGNPSGSLTYSTSVVRDNISYPVKTRVTWIDDNNDGVFPLDSDPRDYKRVQVTISLPAIVDLPNQVFTTDITRQSQEQIASGGNIEVSVVDPENNPLDEVLAKITAGPGGAQELNTDETGKATFMMLQESASEGDYSLSVEKEGYVIEPTMRNQTTTVSHGEVRILQFTLSVPGRLNVTLADEDTGEVINSPSKITLNYPSASPLEYPADTGAFNIEGLYPGVYEIKAENSDYELLTERDVAVEVDKTANLTLRLKRKKQGNIHLTVTDQETGTAVPYANVLITGLDTPVTFSDITNVQGILEKQIGQQRFRLQVSKSGYETNTSTFAINKPGNTFIDVALTRSAASGGSIRVILQYRNGKPREGIPVWVQGPGNYSRQILTDSNGEAVFSGLIYGWYNVFCYTWGWRLIGQPLIRVGQEKTYRVRY